MKESYGEGLATHTDPESCVIARKGEGEALRGTCRLGIEPRNTCPVARAMGPSGCRRCGAKRKAISEASFWPDAEESRAVRDPTHVRKHSAREPGGPTSVCGSRKSRPHREVQGHTPMTNRRGKSDSCVVPTKSPNKAGTAAAEAMEGRRLVKGNSVESNAFRTPCRSDAPSALERVRQA